MSEKSIITLGVLFSLCFVALLWFLNQNKTQTVSIPAKEKVVTVIPTPIVVDTSNWKTYTDKYWKYSVMYPSDWKVITHDKPTINLMPESMDEFLNGLLTISLSLNQETPLAPTGYDVKFDQTLCGNSTWAMKDINNNVICWIYNRDVTFNPHNNLDQSVYSQILSTFKFTESTSLNFSKKHFSSSDIIFDNKLYPSEIVNLKDSDLVGFTCGNKFNKQPNGSFIYYNNDPQQYQEEILKDVAVLDYLKTIPTASTVTVCKTEDNKIFLNYEIQGHGGGAGSTNYFGYLNGLNSGIAEIPIEMGPYFSCLNILAITKENTVYVECGAGDGGYSSKSFYRVGLYKAYTSDLLYKCSSIQENENSMPVITCGTKQ